MKGNFVRYEISVPQKWDDAWFVLRYAREMKSNAKLRLSVDERQHDLNLSVTSGWGFTARDWKYESVHLGELANGKHSLRLESLENGSNVNLDGFYLIPVQPKSEWLTTNDSMQVTDGSPLVATLAKQMGPFATHTPVALPFSSQKTVQTSGGEFVVYEPTSILSGNRRNNPKETFKLMPAGVSAWKNVEQELVVSPVPTVVTKFYWDDFVMTQSVFAAPGKGGEIRECEYWFRITLENKTQTQLPLRLAVTDSLGQKRVHLFPKTLFVTSQNPIATATTENFPGPMGKKANQNFYSVSLDKTLSFEVCLGNGVHVSFDDAMKTSQKIWDSYLKHATQIHVPDTDIQLAFDGSLRHCLAMIEQHPKETYARILKGMEHYYGSNPYDTFQGSRTFDSVNLPDIAEEILRNQMSHLIDAGIFEMWINPNANGISQWITQGLVGEGLWQHYELWRKRDWFREITPSLVKAAEVGSLPRLETKAEYNGIDVSGLVTPCTGDGG
ncbi:MAG: hypothetical protein LBU65_09995, partial [Planctomycetaceae bacterium]|nr:hypothetical protein [Planctomycetaceae bacterium]